MKNAVILTQNTAAAVVEITSSLNDTYSSLRKTAGIVKFAMTLVVLSMVMLLLGGCWSSKGMYRTSSGVEFETTEEMAYLMSARDMEVTRTRGFYDAIAKASKPEQVVAATAAFFGNPGHKLERKKTWDERALPWVQVLAPYMGGYLGGAKSGESTAQIDGDGNTVYISRDEVSGNSSKGAYIYPSTTISYQTQTGTDASANGDGTYQPTYDSSHDNGVPAVQ